MIGLMSGALFGAPPAAAEEAVCDGSGASGADFNGDRVPDVFLARPEAAAGGEAVEAGLVVAVYGGGRGSSVLSQETPGIVGTSEPFDRFGYAVAAADLNGDRCTDLLVSTPFEDLGAKADAGIAWAVYGSPAGLDPATSVQYTQDSPGFPGVAEAGDRFGYALDASYGEFAIGAPGEAHHASRAGSVYVAVGGAVRVVHQDVDGVPGDQEAGDRFGSAVAVDANLLVVGVPGESIGSRSQAGLTQVFNVYTGRPVHAATVSQDSDGIAGTAEAGDRFGAAVDVSHETDPDGETLYHWAVGSPGESVAAGERANGLVHVISAYGDGTAAVQGAVFSQDTPGVEGDAEPGDRFGSGVVLSRYFTHAGDTESDGTALAVTASGEASDAEEGPGLAAQLFRRSAEVTADDVWAADGRHGLPDDASLGGGVRMGADHVYLAADDGTSVYALPLRGLFHGADEPVGVYVR